MKRIYLQKRLWFFLLGLLVVLALPLRVESQADAQSQVEEGWCCYQGQISLTSPHECNKKGGHFFRNKKKAEEYCFQNTPGWCCFQGQATASTRAECDQKKGTFFLDKAEADKNCRIPVVKKWEPIRNVISKNLALTGTAKVVSPRPKELVKILQDKISGNTLRILGNPGHAPVPATADCVPTVYIWSDPAVPDNVYFADQEFTLHYSVDCATAVSVGSLDFYSTAEALYFAQHPDQAGDHASNAIYYKDAVAAGKLQGSIHVAAGSLTPGYYMWNIWGRNKLNNWKKSSETLVFYVITRAGKSGACADYADCIDAMARHIAPLISSGITNNAALDANVEAFRDKILNRQVIGYQLQREIELLSSGTTIECTICTGTSGWNDNAPNVITLYFCPGNPPQYVTDYGLLHELTHKVGFNSKLINAYIAAGLWEPAASGSDKYKEYKQLVETMAAKVAGAAFDIARTCMQY